MPRQIKTIQGHLNDANAWVTDRTGTPLSKSELELFFREKLSRLKIAHLAARFESYVIEDCLQALELIGSGKKSMNSKL